MGKRRSYGRATASPGHRGRPAVVEGSAIGAGERLRLFYATMKGAESPAIGGLLLTAEDMERMTLGQICDAKCSTTTLDLMSDAKKAAYLERACHRSRLLAACDQLSIDHSSPAYSQGEISALRFPTAVTRATPEHSGAHGGVLNAGDEQRIGAAKEKEVNRRISAVKLNPGYLRHYVTLAVRWALPEFEQNVAACTRILLACGDLPTVLRLYSKSKAVQSAAPPQVLVQQLVDEIQLPPFAEPKTYSQVLELLGLVEKLKVAEQCQSVTQQCLEYLVTCRSYKPLLRFSKSLAMWRWKVAWSWYSGLLDEMFAKGDHAAAGQFCKFVNVPRLQLLYLQRLTQERAVAVGGNAAKGPHEEFGFIRELLERTDDEERDTDSGRCYAPRHPLDNGSVEEDKEEGMALYRLASVFASQFKPRTQSELTDLIGSLVTPGHVPYYLPEENITAVDSEESLAAAMAYFGQPPSWTRGVDCVGLDMEMEPSRAKGQRNPSALFQVSTRHRSFLIDLLTLGDRAVPLIRLLFTSRHWIKVGLGFDGDLKNLRSSYPAWGCFDDIELLLDINEVYRSLHPSQSAIGDASLDKLCLYTFGRHMDKGQQCSNWAARPLTEGQRRYAALDALVLVQMFDLMRGQLASYTGGDVDHFLSNRSS